MTTRLPLLALLALILGLGSIPSWAQSAPLDPSFAENGLGRYLDPDQGGPGGSAFDMTVLPDGRLVVVGVAADGFRPFVLRLLPDGTPDGTFGTNGVVELAAVGQGIAFQVAVQADGRTVVGGTRLVGGELGNDPFLVRLTESGALDSSFGTNGIARPGTSIRSEYTPFALLPDGGLIVAGFIPDMNVVLYAIRLDVAGVKDPAFGIDGDGGTGAFLGGAEAQPTQVLLDAQGRITIVGNGVGGPEAQALVFAARFDAEGNPDLAFGTDGVVTTVPPAGFGLAYDAAFTDHGLVTVGSDQGDNEETHVLLIRYTEAGAVDTSFGVNGFVIAGGPNETASATLGFGALAVRPDGTLMVAAADGIEPGGPALVFQFTPDGQPDADFGVNGAAPLVGSEPLSVTSAVLQGDRLVLAGGIGDGDGGPVLVARLQRPMSNSTEAVGVPTSFGFEAAYPNPFTSTLTLRYRLDTAASVRLAVYDLLGREVAVLAEGPEGAGSHTATLDGLSLPAGTYVARLQMDARTETLRVTRVR